MTGPFTLEAVPAPAVRPVTEVVIEQKPASLDAQATLPDVGLLDAQAALEFTEDVSVARYGETYRQRQWRDELLACRNPRQRWAAGRVQPAGAVGRHKVAPMRRGNQGSG